MPRQWRYKDLALLSLVPPPLVLLSEPDLRSETSGLAGADPVFVAHPSIFPS